jgi:hypothetical protein
MNRRDYKDEAIGDSTPRPPEVTRRAKRFATLQQELGSPKSLEEVHTALRMTVPHLQELRFDVVRDAAGRRTVTDRFADNEILMEVPSEGGGRP